MKSSHIPSVENEFAAFETKITEQLSNLTFDKLSTLANDELEYAKLLFTYSEENYSKETKVKDPINCFEKAMLVAIDAMTHAWFVKEYTKNIYDGLDGSTTFKNAFFLFGSYIDKKIINYF